MTTLIRLPDLFTVPRPKPARPRLRAVTWPHAVEHTYAATLIFAAKQVTRAVQREVLPRVQKLLSASRLVRTDDTNETLHSLIAAIKAEYGVSTKVARRWAIEMLDGVSGQHAAEFTAGYGQVIAINPYVGNEKWLPEAMRLAVQENVGLIQSIPDRTLTEIEVLVHDALLGGMRVEELASRVMERCDVGERRAALIARDQVGKFHGSLQRLRQQDAGIEEYTWSTSQDEKVRASHRALEGRTFRWDQPPVVNSRGKRGHPGVGDIACRCVAVPVLRPWEEGEL
jgi:SPP1 gp7 family putative phage head morphogenesis protein